MELSIGILILVILAVVFVGIIFAIVGIAAAMIRLSVKLLAWPFKRRRSPMLPPPRLPPQVLALPSVQRQAAKVAPRSQVVEPASCPRDNCRQLNPGHAQFCRRCGMNLVAVKAYGPAKAQRELVA